MELMLLPRGGRGRRRGREVSVAVWRALRLVALSGEEDRGSD